MNRRHFLVAGAGLLAAPAIVRVGSLMPISVPWMDFEELMVSLPGRRGGRWVSFDYNGTINKWTGHGATKVAVIADDQVVAFGHKIGPDGDRRVLSTQEFDNPPRTPSVVCNPNWLWRLA